MLNNAFRLWELGGTVPVGMYNSFGVSLLGLDDGTVDQGLSDAAGRLTEGGAEVGNLHSLVLLSYAVNPLNRLSLGVNVSGAYESNWESGSRKGIGLDLGISYRLPRGFRMGEHIIGASTVNLIAPSMGSSLRPDAGSPDQYSRDPQRGARSGSPLPV
jgi:hypothetical protein